MRIMIDTNVLISGVFLGGFPRKILSAVVAQKITACVTTEIINEYEEILREMLEKYENIQIMTAKCFCEKYMLWRSLTLHNNVIQSQTAYFIFPHALSFLSAANFIQLSIMPF